MRREVAKDVRGSCQIMFFCMVDPDLPVYRERMYNKAFRCAQAWIITIRLGYQTDTIILPKADASESTALMKIVRKEHPQYRELALLLAYGDAHFANRLLVTVTMPACAAQCSAVQPHCTSTARIDTE